MKYCGGCNQQYNRVEVVSDFKKKVDQTKLNLEFVSIDAENIDIVININGCPTGCADREEIRDKAYKAIVMFSKVDLFQKELKNSEIE